MAQAFSFQCPPFQLLDNHSVFLHNTQVMSSGLIVEKQGMINANVGDHVHESHKQNSFEADSSIVVDTKIINSSCNDQITVNPISLSDNKRKNSAFSSLNSYQSKKNGRVKGKKEKNCNSKIEENKKKKKKEPRKVSSEEESPTGYIHVRARRGQATDSHSLAERVRREKISERMKALQRLVPGCDTITGKALVLDEIINYVQSLQSQVEMLSLKLAAVDPFFCASSGMDVSALMMTQESLSLSSLPSSAAVVPLQLQKCSPNQPTTFADSNTTITAAINVYPPLHTSSPSLLLPNQNPHHDDFSLLDILWDMGEQQSQNVHFQIHAS